MLVNVYKEILKKLLIISFNDRRYGMAYNLQIIKRAVPFIINSI